MDKVELIQHEHGAYANMAQDHDRDGPAVLRGVYEQPGKDGETQAHQRKTVGDGHPGKRAKLGATVRSIMLKPRHIK